MHNEFRLENFATPLGRVRHNFPRSRCGNTRPVEERSWWGWRLLNAPRKVAGGSFLHRHRALGNDTNRNDFESRRHTLGILVEGECAGRMALEGSKAARRCVKFIYM